MPRIKRIKRGTLGFGLSSMLMSQSVKLDFSITLMHFAYVLRFMHGIQRFKVRNFEPLDAAYKAHKARHVGIWAKLDAYVPKRQARFFYNFNALCLRTTLYARYPEVQSEELRTT